MKFNCFSVSIDELSLKINLIESQILLKISIADSKMTQNNTISSSQFDLMSKLIGFHPNSINNDFLHLSKNKNHNIPFLIIFLLFDGLAEISVSSAIILFPSPKLLVLFFLLLPSSNILSSCSLAAFLIFPSSSALQ